LSGVQVVAVGEIRNVRSLARGDDQLTGGEHVVGDGGDGTDVYPAAAFGLEVLGCSRAAARNPRGRELLTEFDKLSVMKC
jgi:hypothetical protein